MEKLNRLGWADGLTFEAYGLHLGIRTNEPAIVPGLESLLPFGWTPSNELEVDHLLSVRVGDEPGSGRRVRRKHLVHSDSTQIATSRELDQALDALRRELHLLVGEFAHEHVFVHAGVVGWNGRAIIMPGRTFTGKSRLVAALVRAGASYYSDEFAVLDTNSRVHPFARPISIRRESDHVGQPVDPVSLGGTVGEEPLPVGMVLMCRYRSGATWRPRRLRGGRPVLDLLANTLSARRQPELVLPVLHQVATAAPTYRASRDDADAVAPRVLGLCDRAHRRAG